MNLATQIKQDSMEIYSFMDKQARTYKFRCCRFTRSYTVMDLRPKVIKARYSGVAVFHVN